MTPSRRAEDKEQQKPRHSGSQPESPLTRPLVSISALILFMGVVYAFAGAGGLVTASSVDDWYQALTKPALTPPDWIFPIVWNFLYFLMGLAAWLVWRAAGGIHKAGMAFALFALQLTLNFAWSVVFFGLRDPGLASLEIIALEAAAIATMLVFWRIDRMAGLLFLPYVVWTLFAVYLTFSVWLLNR